jgi:putative exosortase-associated protein (TIGR04073 family)
MMRKMLVIIAVVIFASSLAYAAECQVCSGAKSDVPWKAYCYRVGCGLCNAAFGWTEIFFRPGKVVAEGGNPIVGFFRGIGNAITRTAVGTVEVATFWTPGKSVVVMEDCPLCAYK